MTKRESAMKIIALISNTFFNINPLMRSYKCEVRHNFREGPPGKQRKKNKEVDLQLKAIADSVCKSSYCCSQ